jgi:hypothetical protein
MSSTASDGATDGRAKLPSGGQGPRKIHRCRPPQAAYFNKPPMVRFPSPLVAPALALLGLGLRGLNAAPAPDATAWNGIEPVLAQRCYECHNAKKSKGDVNLEALARDPKVAEQFELWAKVRDTVQAGDMPPAKAKPLAEPQRKSLVGWVEGQLDALAQANSGDPGPVTLRRLSNAEYDRSLRDLTGLDLKLAREFQSDGGGGEGFSNTGDVLFVSPAAMDKYLAAARKLADQATIMPGTGIVFHPQRIGLRGPEQVKAQAQQALYVWYQQKAAPHLPKDFDPMHEGRYLTACWKHRHLGKPLAELAKSEQLSPHFLQNWWNLLQNPQPQSRFLDLLRLPWRALPGPDATKPGEVPAAVSAAIAQMEADLLSWNNPKKPGSGVQRQQQDADGIRTYTLQVQPNGARQVFLNIGDCGDGAAGDVALVTQLEIGVGGKKLAYAQWLKSRLEQINQALAPKPASGAKPDAKPSAPAASPEALRREQQQLQALLALFGRHPLDGRPIEAHVLGLSAPRALALPLPPKCYHLRAQLRLDLNGPQAEQASIQWALSLDQPRAVNAIMPGVLTIWKRSTPKSGEIMRDFQQMKMAFPDMFERRLEEVANNLYRNGRPGISVYYFSDDQLGALLGPADRNHLQAMKLDWAMVQNPNAQGKKAQEFDQAILDHLKALARRAWRRPLEPSEVQELAALYKDGRDKGLDRESAAREVLVLLLASPHFLFKAETLPATLAQTDKGSVALSAHALATRLSYFLWSSLPDAELARCADDGSLLKDEVLRTQTLRLLRDPRAAALAEEFAGQWLKFKDFENHDGVDRQLFPQFTDDLRADMQREVNEFFTHLFREDRPVRDILSANYSFLNERLAAHYGIAGVTGPQWREVKLNGQPRGGLLGMGAILTKTSRPQRTSPVLRGDYLHQVVLGFSSPPPPPNVPKLKDSQRPSSLREQLLQHRADAACSVCHDRIDPLGFALESFDPVGRFRAKDNEGGLIDDHGALKDGTPLHGFAGLRAYLEKNAAPFENQWCRKLLGFALGRAVLPTDKDLLQQMRQALLTSGGKPSAAILQIVQSRSFKHRRAEPLTAATPTPAPAETPAGNPPPAVRSGPSRAAAPQGKGADR